MATLNLGNIKLNWKGAYAGGTAYVVDDVVSYSGSSYICKLASTGNLPTNGTYWDQVASAGTNGTDLTSTLTTQGDVLIRDGSGLARLGYGTSGKVLTTKGSGQNPTWETAAGGKVLQVVTNHDNTEKDLATGSTMTNYSELNTSITPSATNSKILVMVHFGALQYGGNDSSLGYGKVMYQISGGSVQDFGGSEQLGANAMGVGGKHQFAINLETNEWQTFQPSMVLLHEPNTTTSTSYQAFFQAESSNGILKINKNYRNSGNDCSTISTMTLMEIGA